MFPLMKTNVKRLRQIAELVCHFEKCGSLVHLFFRVNLSSVVSDCIVIVSVVRQCVSLCPDKQYKC